MRPVRVFKNMNIAGTVDWEIIDDGTALFHQFGIDFVEFETGAGNFTTAIIELADGTIEFVPAICIRFMGNDF